MKQFSSKILAWYHKQGRKHLAWQQNPTPYRVWVSEIMLQQTQVATVIPYYNRFMKRFPNITSLAKANLDEVLTFWTGLGYYARARNLHKTAGIIQEKYQGEFPLEYEAVHALPGIGRSTAGAILALSSEQSLPILDGNVKRVLARHFAVEGFPSLPQVQNKLWTLSEALLPKKELRHYTQALMDLGAMVCTRTQPSCELCPIQKTCQARLQGRIHEFPQKKAVSGKPVRTTIWMVYLNEKQQTVLLQKREMTGIWGGLWSFPEVLQEELDNMKRIIQTKQRTKPYSLQQPFMQFRHSFTHFHLDVAAYLIPAVRQQSQQASAWYPIHEPLPVGVPAPVQRIVKELQCHIPCFV